MSNLALSENGDRHSTNGAVSRKLANFARLDPDLQARNVTGLKHGAKGEERVWAEFHGNWEKLGFESELILAKYKGIAIESIIDLSDMPETLKGKEREAIVKIRVNQGFFRKTILASYNNSCCITGIHQPELLIASHIRPWKLDDANRLNPQNGMCLNALHDKAFEYGLITISPDYQIKISPVLLRQSGNQAIADNFLKYNNKPMLLPSRFLPDPAFLIYHNNERFIQ